MSEIQTISNRTRVDRPKSDLVRISDADCLSIFQLRSDRIYIKIAIVDTILLLESESDRYRRLNSDGLKSELWTIQFVGPNCMSLQFAQAYLTH